MNEVHEMIELVPSASLEQDSVTIREEVGKAEITTQESYVVVLGIVQRIKRLIGKIEEHHAPMKKKSDDLHKTICAQEKALTKPLQEAERAGKRKMEAWDAEQKRVREAAAAKLRAEAEAAEARERAKAAKKAEKAGDVEKAAAIREAPSEVPVFVVEAPKVAGVDHREEWGEYEILDPEKIPRAYLCPDHVKMKKHGQVMKQDAVIPGVRFYPTVRTSVKK